MQPYYFWKYWVLFLAQRESAITSPSRFLEFYEIAVLNCRLFLGLWQGSQLNDFGSLSWSPNNNRSGVFKDFIERPGAYCVASNGMGWTRDVDFIGTSSTWIAEVWNYDWSFCNMWEMWKFHVCFDSISKQTIIYIFGEYDNKESFFIACSTSFLASYPYNHGCTWGQVLERLVATKDILYSSDQFLPATWKRLCS